LAHKTGNSMTLQITSSFYF